MIFISGAWHFLDERLWPYYTLHTLYWTILLCFVCNNAYANYVPPYPKNWSSIGWSFVQTLRGHCPALIWDCQLGLSVSMANLHTLSNSFIIRNLANLNFSFWQFILLSTFLCFWFFWMVMVQSNDELFNNLFFHKQWNYI